MPRSKKPTKASSVTKQMVKRKKKKTTSYSGQQLITTGSSMLDLSLSASAYGGLAVGKIINIVGDSHAGKSILANTVMAVAANDPRFKDYDLVYDDVEEAQEFNTEYLFGNRYVERVRKPLLDPDTGDYENSDTVEDFEAAVWDLIDAGRPFIYILDSFDSLTSVAELEKTKKRIDAHKKGKKTAGDYGMEKPKFSSTFLRKVKKRLAKMNSLLIIVSQTRDDINPMTFTQKTRSGGRALEFYSTQIFWLAAAKKIKRTVKGNEEVIGLVSRAKTTKSRLTGRYRIADFHIFYDYGIDDIGSCLEWLTKRKFWPASGQSITATDLGLPKMTRTKLIDYIEENGLEDALKEAVQKYWDELEEAMRLDRKKRFN